MSSTPSTRILARGLALAIVAGVASSAHAATLRWQEATGGHFNDAANWDLGYAPTSSAGDEAIFGLDASYSVLGAIDAATLSVEAGDVAFDSGYAAFWNIGAGAGQTAGATVTGFMQGDFGMRIGTGAGSTGAFTLAGPSAEFTLFGFAGDDIVVGRAGELASGRLEVNGGATLNTYGVQTHGETVVTGAGSSLGMYFAEVAGRMDIASGASVGATEWTVRGEININDGRMVSDGALNAFAGSRITVTGGALDSAYPMHFNGATLAIEGASTVSADELQFHNGTIELGVDASSFSAVEPLISASRFGDFENSELAITLLDGFTPLVGQSLHLMRIEDTMSGAFENPFTTVRATGFSDALAAELQFSKDAQSGGYDAYVTFIPTPGAGALLALAAPLLLQRRR